MTRGMFGSLVLLVTVGTLGFSVASCAGDNGTRPFSAVTSKRPSTTPLEMPLGAGGIKTVTVELALNRVERDRGLMHRTDLAEDAGMLFIFSDDQPRTFWMRNTLVPLDILFLDADGTIQNIERGEPAVERPGYHSLRPARMVLELNAGWCERHGVKPGARVGLEPALLDLAEV